MWYKMWYKSEALSASGMLNAIYIKGLRGVCGGGAGISRSPHVKCLISLLYWPVGIFRWLQKWLHCMVKPDIFCSELQFWRRILGSKIQSGTSICESPNMPRRRCGKRQFIIVFILRIYMRQ